MPTYSHPGVYVEEVPQGGRLIAASSTSTTLFVGWAARGPVERCGSVTGFADCERLYGGLDARTWLGHALKHYFDNGGTRAHVLRIVDATARSATALVGGLRFTATSPGAWANDHRLRITPRADDATRGRLAILRGAADTVVETFDDVSTTPTDPRFVERVLDERSAIATVRVEQAALADATVALAGGSDGTVVGPGDAAFHAAVRAGFGPDAPTDRIDDVDLVCVPGLADAPTIVALQHDGRRRRTFLIVDAPRDATTRTVAASLVDIAGPAAIDSAVYFPWVTAPDPLAANAVRDFPPSGFVAGVYARTDRQRGVWKPPAGREATLVGATGLATRVDDAEQSSLASHGIDCLRVFARVAAPVVWGARTLSPDGSARSDVAVRRLTLFVENSLSRGLQWTVFEPNDERLWAGIRTSVGLFLQDLWQRNAFAGTTPGDAWFVRCDRTTTTEADLAAGELVVLVGFAPVKPAEFVLLRMRLRTATA